MYKLPTNEKIKKSKKLPEKNIYNCIQNLISVKRDYLNYQNAYILKSDIYLIFIGLQSKQFNIMKQLFLAFCLFALIMQGSPSKMIDLSPPDCESNDCKHEIADKIFFNGHIITMESESERAEFVAIKQGKILAVSRTKEQMGRFVGKNTQMINLKGKTLMPGLVDGHSHFSGTAVRLSQNLNLSPPPFGKITSIPLLLDQLRRYMIASNIQPGQTVYGAGYNDLDMVERRHPTRYELDSVSTVNPIMLQHFSGHIVVANSLALSMVNYVNASSSRRGGVIDAYPNGTITGVCREWAILDLLGLFQLTFKQLTTTQIQAAVNQYFSCGVTTAHDMVSEGTAATYTQLGADLSIDVNGYYLVLTPDLTAYQRVMATYNTNNYKTRGAKFIADGSIQGYTAYLTQPYWVPQSMYSDDLTNYTYDDSRSCSTEDCGHLNYPVTLLRSQMQVVLAQNADVLVHCNGDKASDSMIEAVQWVRNNTQAQNDARVIMIHAQTVREDQLDQFQRLRINPSFFPAHLYYWGDKHYNIFLGPTRAVRMNPAGSALRRKLKFTIHNDSPVVLAGIFNGVNAFFKLVSAAVNRLTSSGRLIDDGTQKISVYQALKALTINGAWQSRQENLKGSLKVGKVADLIILDQNPLSIEPIKLDTLKVLATIKGGKLVFGSYPHKRDDLVQQ